MPGKSLRLRRIKWVSAERWKSASISFMAWFTQALVMMKSVGKEMLIALRLTHCAEK
jgi:hypothetical protein